MPLGASRGSITEEAKQELEDHKAARMEGDALDAEAALQQRSIAHQLQARVEQARARIRDAPSIQRASILREEVSLFDRFQSLHIFEVEEV